MKWMIGALFGAASMASVSVAQANTAPAAAAATRIPTEILAKSPLVSGPQLSPDGRKLMAMIGTSGAGGTASLGLNYVETGEVRLLALPKDYEVVFYRWAGDNKVLISLGKTTDYFGQDAYMTRLVAYDIVARKIEFIGKREQGLLGDDILHLDPDGKWLLLAIQKTVFDWPSVHRVDLVTGQMKEVQSARPGIMGWYADGNGVVRAGIGFERAADRYTMLYRSPGGPLRSVGGGRGETVPIGDLRFAVDGDSGFVLSSEATGRDAIYAFDFATLKRGARVFEAPANDVDSFTISPDGRSVLAAFYADTRDRVEWFDPAMKEVQTLVDRAIKNKEAWIVSRSRDDSAMLVLVTGANDPGSYYYFQPDIGEMKRLAWINEAIKPYRLAAAKPVTFKARDGLAIPGYLTLPNDRPAKNLPLIVMPHGGPYGIRDRGDYDAEVQLLANRGYGVLQPNYRGSGSYGRAFEDKGAGQWGRAMQDDLDDGVDWLAKEGIVDPKRVCIVGASYGGYAAMWGATRNPERYRCAASFAGVSDLPRQLRYSRNFFLSARKAKSFRDRVKGDESFRLSDISPIDHVGKLSVPVLIAHGDQDQRVPLKQSAIYAAALAKAGRPHEYKVYQGEGHGLTDPKNRKDYFDRLEAFLRKHNPPD
jgi:dipeptidyl aminopeptidase/acylaminoacyl peptidase